MLLGSTSLHYCPQPTYAAGTLLMNHSEGVWCNIKSLPAIYSEIKSSTTRLILKSASKLSFLGSNLLANRISDLLLIAESTAALFAVHPKLFISRQSLRFLLHDEPKWTAASQPFKGRCFCRMEHLRSSGWSGYHHLGERPCCPWSWNIQP